MKKSYARIKFFGVIGFGWFVAFFINFIKDEYINGALVLIFFACAIYTMLVRCENCGVYMYRYNSKQHGLPHPKCFSFTNKCPACDVERI